LYFFGIRVCLKTKDYFGRTLAGTITSMIAAQTIINICVVIGVLPVTGLTLPFLSSGGTSLLISMASAGIILNIARQNFTMLKKRDSELAASLKEDNK
jgi:cell division protein FtsW